MAHIAHALLPESPRLKRIQPNQWEISPLRTTIRKNTLWSVLIWLVLQSFGGPAAQAGLAPSEVVVVVNGGSLNSRTLANHYVQLRNIPSRNVIVLETVPSSEVIPVAQFRETILKPVLDEITNRNLAGHVQCITYSADFPTGIDISKDLASLENRSKVFTPRASINALTYLYRLTLAGDASYILPESNFYARRSIDSYFANPAGKSTEVRWREVEMLSAEANHPAAMQLLEELFAEQPHQFPLAYLAAGHAAQAGQKQKAIDLLESAIAGGWNAGGYLANDKRFDSLRDEADFQLLEFLTDTAIANWQPAIGFDARTTWTPNGIPLTLAPSEADAFGFRYLLSTSLGVTRGGGTTLAQAVESLQRSAQADYTHPQGGFYFSFTRDVRTTTRQPAFESTVEMLQSMGFEADIITTSLPMNQPAVLGAQIGTPNFDWSTCGSVLVPGSIAENLTSLGGVMASSGGQTKLTELIIAGAAGSSGTVTEPYALQFKFPHPQLYVHYAQGASLAEAFYSSVTGPYQLLIVGDPLCQPFSNAPEIAFEKKPQEIKHGESVHLEPQFAGVSYSDWLTLEPLPALRHTPLQPNAVTVLFDGTNPQRGEAKPNININLNGQPSGFHDLRLIFSADDPLMQKSEVQIPVWYGSGRELTLQIPDAASSTGVSLQDETFTAHILAPESSKRVSVWHDYEKIAEIEGYKGDLEIPIVSLGMGTVRLQARAELPNEEMQSEPIWINILP